MRVLVAVFLLLNLVTPVVADDLPDMERLREGISAAREQTQDLYLKGSQLLSVTSGGQPLGPPFESTLTVYYATPDLVRIEATSPMGDSVQNFDGQNTVTFLKNLGEYTSTAGAPDLAKALGMGSGEPTSIKDSVLNRFLPELPADAEAVGYEDLNGLRCAVARYTTTIPDPAGGSYTPNVELWIDLENFRVMRQIIESERELQAGMVGDMRLVLTVSEFALNGDLGQDVFAFEAPADAKLVEFFNFPGQRPASLKGRPAPDFELEALDGEKVRLSELRGQVVMLDFWATWCGPCKVELPHVDALRKEFAEDGLVVFGISNEEPSKVQRYLEKSGLGLPSLVDVGGAVSMQYQVRSIPTTLIIDREGNVAEHFVGAQPESRLRAGLALAGLE